MKQGDRVITRFFSDIEEQAEQFIDKIGVHQGNLLSGNISVHGQSWPPSSLELVKKETFFRIGQKVYSHLFLTEDCSGVVTNISANGKIHVESMQYPFVFQYDGRYTKMQVICLFQEPIQRPQNIPLVDFDLTKQKLLTARK